MKFSIHSTAFSKVMQAVLKVIPRNGALPILDNVLLNVERECVGVTASDSNTTLRVAVKEGGADLHVEQGGSACIPARLFAEILATVPAGPVCIASCEGETKITISWNDHSESSLPSFNVMDYPLPPDGPERVRVFEVDAAPLLGALRHAVPVVQPDPIRPAM